MKYAGINLPRASKRLKVLFDEAMKLSDGDIVADIGADHGYLAAMLKSSGKFAKVIATDISAESLKKTQNLAKSLNLEIECKVGDGLFAAPEATMACVCGMGGYEIIKILKNNSEVKKFVFQPVQNAIELRMFLLKNHYKIVADFVIEDNQKFYPIICVNSFGRNYYRASEKFFGKKTGTFDKDFINYVQNWSNRLKFLENFDITNLDEQKNLIFKKKIYDMTIKILK